VCLKPIGCRVEPGGRIDHVDRERDLTLDLRGRIRHNDDRKRRWAIQATSQLRLLQEVESMMNQRDVGTRIDEHLLLTHIENDTGSDEIALSGGVYCVILPIRLLLTVGVRRCLGLRGG
jgi:hypothetical protein